MLLLTAVTSAYAQRLVTWTEEPGELGLGYPVPIPQSTPLPFAGFRSYFPLRARHLDLANTNDAIHAFTLGSSLAGRDIDMYILSDADIVTVDNRLEGSVLINGGIHAREWQSPEVVTGIMELFAANSQDEFFLPIPAGKHEHRRYSSAKCRRFSTNSALSHTKLS